MTDDRLHLADAVTGLVVGLSGLYIATEAWNMPRFEERAINPWTVPGIMPGFVGAVLSILGFLLLIRGATKRLAARTITDLSLPDTKDGPPALVGVPALAICLGLGLIYVAMIGHVPFMPLSFAFLFAFMAAFEAPALRHARRRSVRVLAIATLAGSAAALIPLLFRDVFLVELP